MNKTLFLTLLLLTTHAFANEVNSLSSESARSIANAAIAFYNVTHGGHERLFEYRSKVDARNCVSVNKITTCTFETVENWDTDSEVYSANEPILESFENN